MHPYRRGGSRRGVLLLVVLSLLVLFMLIGTAFLMSSNQYSRGSRASAKLNRVGNHPTKLLDRAVMQVIRDTNNPNSVLRGHSLFRDMYGTDGFEAAVYSPETLNLATPLGRVTRFAAATDGTVDQQLGPTQGQMIDLYVRALGYDSNATTNRSEDDPLTDVNERTSLVSPDARHVVKLEPDPNGQAQLHILPLTRGYYNGCLLTITSGPAAGETTRILEYEYIDDLQYPNSPPTRLFRFRVMAFPRSDGLPLQIDPVRTPELADLAGATFVVNGRPFSGTGVGYNLLAPASWEPNTVGPRLTARETIRLGSVAALDPTTASLDQLTVHYPEIALTPNFSTLFLSDPTSTLQDDYGARYLNTSVTPLEFRPLNPRSTLPANRAALWNYKTFEGPGGSKESYDAADYQNMFLALQTVTPRAQGRVVHEGTPPVYLDVASPEVFNNANQFLRLDLEDLPLPSFHRPALVNFWFHRLIDYAANPTGGMADPGDDHVAAVLTPYGADGIRDAPGVSNDDPTGVPLNVRDQIVALKRKISLRPLREDHPNFDGSNSQSRPADLSGVNNLVITSSAPRTWQISVPYWEAVGPWDVDNDNDGVPDSVWVDLGEPVAQAEDGTLYKPLFAFLVMDLDSRLNVNAHGLVDDLNLPPNLDISTLATGAGNLANDISPTANDLSSSNAMPHGLGYGPAEISLRPFLSPQLPSYAAGGVLPTANVGNPGFGDLMDADDYARLLLGRPTSSTEPSVWGRHGSVDVWNATALTASELVKPGMTYDNSNAAATSDTLASLDYFEYPSWISYYYADRFPSGKPLVPTAFSSPPDLFGRYAIGLDYVGQPVFEQAADYAATVLAGGPLADRTMLHDSPYELNLANPVRRDALDPAAATDMAGVINSGGMAAVNDDAPFATADLERILRSYDADAGILPDRLWNVVDAFDPVKLVNNQPEAVAATSLQMFGTSDEPQMLAAAQQISGINRRLVTTDSYDLPVPAASLPNQSVLAAGADGAPGRFEIDDDNLNGVDDAGELGAAGSDDFRILFGKDPSQGTIVDLATYRVWKEIRGQIMRANGQTEADLTAMDAATYQGFLDDVTAQADAVLNGEPYDDANSNGRYDPGENYTDVHPNNVYDYPLLEIILPPEIIAGGKLDLNRPFGDGRDNGDGMDNDGDGQIDEPDERFAASPDPYLNGVVDDPLEAGEPFVDLNGNGRRDPGEFFYNVIGGNGEFTDDDALYDGPIDRLWAGLTGEPIAFDYNHGGTATDGRPYDGNGDGDYDDAGVDGRLRRNGIIQRQTMARHLYCLMMLLVDENYVASQNMRPDLAGVYDISFLDENGNFDLFILQQQLALQIAERNLRESGQLNEGTDTTNPAFKTMLGNAVNDAKPTAYAWILRKLTARKIAQWAINVVDYRDADSIMTPFEYDENPWDGWGVYDSEGSFIPIDGELSTNENWGTDYRRFDPYSDGDNLRNDAEPALIDGTPEEATRDVVWGTERPELLITETLAFHDRRSTDEEDSQGYPPHRLIGNPPTTPTEQDPADRDLDQKLKPRGSLFVELYNPWTSDGNRPAEIYGATAGSGAQQGVMLNRLSAVAALDPTTGQPKHSPVWRMAVLNDPFTGRLSNQVIYPSRDPDPAFPSPTEQAAKQVLSTDPDGFGIDMDQHAERFVYFTTGGDANRQDDNTLVVGKELLGGTGDYQEEEITDPITGETITRYRTEVDQLSVRVPPLPIRWSVVPGSGSNQEEPYPAARRYFVARTERAGTAANDQDFPLSPILPGRYAVVGSSGMQLTGSGVSGNSTPGADDGQMTTRFVTPIGRLVAAENVSDPTSFSRRSLHQTRRIELWPDPNGDPDVQQVLIGENGGQEFMRTSGGVMNVTDPDRDGVPTSGPPANIDPSVAIPVEDLNISEPVEGYPSLLYQKLYLLNDPRVIAALEETPAQPRLNFDGDLEYDRSYDRPLDLELELTRNGTTQNYRTLHLQRLADPLLPWNPPPFDKAGNENVLHRPELPVNPYLTIDSQSVDLTAFNGATQMERTQLPVELPPATGGGGPITITSEPVLQGNFFAPITPEELADAPDHVLWAFIFILKQELLDTNGNPQTSIIPKDRWITPADIRAQIEIDPDGLADELEALARAKGILQMDLNSRSALVSDEDPLRKGQWGWHRFRRVLPDDEASDNRSKTGSFRQWLHLKSLERGSHDSVFYKYRSPYKAFYEKYRADYNANPSTVPEGWRNDPNWVPRLLWKQERPNARLFLQDGQNRPRVEASDLENVTSRRQLEAFELTTEEQNLRMSEDEIARNKAVFSQLQAGTGVGGNNHIIDFVLEQTLGFANEAYAPELDRAGNTDAVAIMSNVRPGAPEVATGGSPAEPAGVIPEANAVAYNVPKEIINAPRLAATLDTSSGSNVPKATLLQSLYDSPLPQTNGDETSVENQFFERRRQLMRSTYPWLAWNDRPYTTANEIMQVPAWSSSLMLHQYSAISPATANPYDGFFGDDGTIVDTDGDVDLRDEDWVLNTTYRSSRQLGLFGHLLNYFITSAQTATATVNSTNAVLTGAPNYYRILDYVEVPSRYVGTDDLLTAEFFNDVPGVTDGTAGTVGTDFTGPTDPRLNFQPPFNRVSRQRDPGKVNLNTVVGRRVPGQTGPASSPTPPQIWSEVYDGIMHRYRDGHLRDSSGNLLQVSHFGPAWRDVVLSRKGYAQFNADNPGMRVQGDPGAQPTDGPLEKYPTSPFPDVFTFGLNRGFPTFFANPFRSSTAGDLVPLGRMQQHNVDATWLRVHPRTPGNDNGWGALGTDDASEMVDTNGDGMGDTARNDGLENDAREAGFGDDKVSHRGGPGNGEFRAIPEQTFDDDDRARVPLFSEAAEAAAIDASRNPYMMYQPMTRMENLVTSRSNVYAVWVTVGYFEVEPAPNWNDPEDSIREPLRERFGADTALNASDAATQYGRALYDRVYPEGYMLGQELGSDTGSVKRQRAFYIIDRTEPVGFKPGEDLNVERAIRVRRRIE